MKPIYLIILFLAFVTFSCESLVTNVSPENLPDTESKLVVQAFISPQASQINVAVTESTPLFGDVTANNGSIKNALVKLSDGANEVTIPYDTATNLYSIDQAKFAVVAGKTYTLSVSDSKRNVNASCTVPLKQTTVKSYTIDTTYSNSGLDQDTIITAKMTWQDIPIDTNYYRIRAYLDLEHTILEGNSMETFKEKRVTTRYIFRWDDTIGRSDFQSDANLDGTVFSSSIGRVTLPGVQRYYFDADNQLIIYPKSKIIAITFNIENTDASYFKYHRSLELSDNENPFSEPALIFNNINGGLGCFAAYNTGSLIYKP